MTTTELETLVPRPRGGVRALQAQRVIDVVALRVGPATAAGLISLSHVGLGEALIVFLSVLGCLYASDRSGLPLHLMRASRILLAILTPVIGVAIAWVVVHAAGASTPLGDYAVAVPGAWIVLGLGVLVRSRFGGRVPARVVVVGSFELATDLAAELQAARVRSYELVGWIGDNRRSEGLPIRWLGGLDRVRPTVVREQVDLLVSAPVGPEATEIVSARIAEDCLDLPVRLIAASQFYEEIFGHVPVGMIDAAWFRYIMHPRFRASSPVSKRVFDLVVAGTIAIASLPLLGVAALAIRLGDRGPALYRQLRLGEYGRGFEILKLRTMGVDAERGGPQWAVPEDTRVTRIGRVLRRAHIDELPQMWNVLRGDMSLVGPRPERPEMVSSLERRFPHYTRRHLIKPGIAGWAALRCGYAGSDLGTAWKLCHDLFYIKRRSVLADTLIMVETGIELFRDAHRTLRAPRERFLIAAEVDAAAAGGSPGVRRLDSEPAGERRDAVAERVEL